MVSYITIKANYMEIACLSTDRKPSKEEDVSNGSLLTEMDSGKKFRYNIETDGWIEQGKPYPVNLEITTDGYVAVYSNDDRVAVVPDIFGDEARFVDNGVAVVCKIAKATKSRKK